jgi:hypothetical protein
MEVSDRSQIRALIGSEIIDALINYQITIHDPLALWRVTKFQHVVALEGWHRCSHFKIRQERGPRSQHNLQKPFEGVSQYINLSSLS